MAYKPGVHSEFYRITVSLDTGLSISVLRGAFDVIDHDELQWHFVRLEPESQLLLQRGEDRRRVAGIGGDRRRRTAGLVRRRVREVDHVEPGQPRPVADDPARHAAQL